MCGRLNITDSPGVRQLCEQLDIALWPQEGQCFGRFVGATDSVSIVFEQAGHRVMKNAVWWLLLESSHTPPGQTCFKPSRYTSFNTRYDKLNKPGSAGYQAYRQQRCVIPVKGFGESQKDAGTLYYHDLQVAEGGAMAMGGLYRTWSYRDEEGHARQVYSCSVVTLPPHPKLSQIHQKSSPLMLSETDGSLYRWLDESTTDTAQLEDLLVPSVRHTLIATPIDKPSSHQAVGKAFPITMDT